MLGSASAFLECGDLYYDWVLMVSSMTGLICTDLIRYP